MITKEEFIIQTKELMGEIIFYTKIIFIFVFFLYLLLIIIKLTFASSNNLLVHSFLLLIIAIVHSIILAIEYLIYKRFISKKGVLNLFYLVSFSVFVLYISFVLYIGSFFMISF